jgi:hypothetical protein
VRQAAITALSRQPPGAGAKSSPSLRIGEGKRITGQGYSPGCLSGDRYYCVSAKSSNCRLLVAGSSFFFGA